MNGMEVNTKFNWIIKINLNQMLIILYLFKRYLFINQPLQNVKAKKKFNSFKRHH